MTQHDLFADPWDDVPGHDLYRDLAAVGVGPRSSRSALREGFFDLMEHGLVSERTEQAYQVLEIVSRRLVHDAGFYDAELADELLDFLIDLPQDEAADVPLHEQIHFTWDV